MSAAGAGAAAAPPEQPPEPSPRRAPGPGESGGPVAVVELAVLLLGAALRLWQYGAGASQWLDELALSRGILGLSWRALWSERLAFGQVAPRGFVLLEKAGATLWGASDLGLRLVPLAASLASLWLFAGLARRLLATRAAVVFALVLFALQPELLRYAAQVKPYASDLAVALGLTLLAMELAGAERPAARTALLAGAAGIGAVFVSHAAALVLAGLALGLVAGAAAPGRRPALPRLGLVAATWSAAAGAAALAAHRELPPEAREYLRHYWAPSFAPRPHTFGGDAHWLGSTLWGMLGAGGLGYPWVPVYAGLAVLGVVALFRRRPALAPLLFGPVAVALGAAELRLYPLAVRLVLFALPALFLAVAAGVETLAGMRLPGRGRLAGTGGSLGLRGPALGVAGAGLVFAAALLPALAGFAADPPVYRIEETRPLLRALAARRRPGDAIYVYYAAGHALRYYGPRYGFHDGDYVLGACHRGDVRAYLEEVDRFRGRPRLWVVFSHAQPRLGERESLLAYLDRLGTRLMALRFLPHGRMFGLPAEAFLYDLAGADRTGVAAASFPIAPLTKAAGPIDPAQPCAGPANPYPDLASAAAR